VRLLKLSIPMLMVMGWVGWAWAGDKASGGYKIVQKIPLAGDGGWDFLTVDEAGRRIYITHNNSVQVLDADSLKLVGTVENVPRPHGVVVLPALGRGYITSGDPGSVVVFDLKTLKRLSDIPTAKDSDVILHDESSGNIFTFNGDSQNATVIDPLLGKAVQGVDLGGSPEVAVADGKGHLFDNLNDKNMVLKIDSKTLKVSGRWPTAPGTSPTGMAMDRERQRLFIGCRNKFLIVMDAANGKVIQALPIGEHVDGTVFDSKRDNILSSCGDGTLSVIHEDSPDHYRVLENDPTKPGARTLALDGKTGRLFLPAALSLPPDKPTASNPKPRGKLVPGTFEILVVSP